jgi:predicted DsbA family dithiol-disulfide isomerase
MAVPKVVINDRVGFEGALPERDFLGAVLQAVEGGEKAEA